MSAEELPDKLDKLEIAPILPTLKMADQNLPLRLNPFYDDIRTCVSSDTALEPHNTAVATSRLPANCRRCRLRRRSESVLDDYKVSAGAQLAGVDYDGTWSTRSTPRLQRVSLKKSPTGASGTNGRKLLIREPVLRALQTCCVRRKLLPNAVDDSNIGAVLVSSSSTQQINGVGGEKGISDFRDLIQECQTLLEQDVTFNNGIGCGRLNQLSLGGKKNFTTMRSPCGLRKTRNGRGIISDSSGNLSVASTLLPSSPNNLRSSSPIMPLSDFNSFSTGTSTNASRTNNNSGTSCSQQAGSANNNSATTNATGDDVTIDELASYFDTLVHIPKKMSAMAEMMYI